MPSSCQRLSPDLALRGRWRKWRRRSLWHRPALADASLPDWYKSQLFNELYFLQAGGAVWCDKRMVAEAAAASTTKNRAMDNPDDVGHWLYLEGQEYLYNTADVHFYASAALAMNWPRIERSVQIDYASAVLSEDTQLGGLLGEPRWSVVATESRRRCTSLYLGSPSDGLGEDERLQLSGRQPLEGSMCKVCSAGAARLHGLRWQ